MAYIINDLPQNVSCSTRLVADDTAIYLALSKLDESNSLQNDLPSRTGKDVGIPMEFNPSKRPVIRITRSRTPIPTSYSLHGEILETVEHAKYLGVSVGSKLNWDVHVNNTSLLKQIATLALLKGILK